MSTRCATAALSSSPWSISPGAREQALVQDLVKADQAQEREKGEAQAAAKKRDRAFDDLAEWLSDYREVAKTALDAHPADFDLTVSTST